MPFVLPQWYTLLSLPTETICDTVPSCVPYGHDERVTKAIQSVIEHGMTHLVVVEKSSLRGAAGGHNRAGGERRQMPQAQKMGASSAHLGALFA